MEGAGRRKGLRVGGWGRINPARRAERECLSPASSDWGSQRGRGLQEQPPLQLSWEAARCLKAEGFWEGGGGAWAPEWVFVASLSNRVKDPFRIQRALCKP